MLIDEFRGKFHFLSNFHAAPIIYDGQVYPTTEHAYQAAKTLCKVEREGISLLETPLEAKRAGSDPKQVSLREDWESIKLDVMLEINRIKFNSYTKYKKRLLDTVGHELAEGNNWGDTYWGTVNGKGHNHLGKILMQVREEIRFGYEQFDSKNRLV